MTFNWCHAFNWYHAFNIEYSAYDICPVYSFTETFHSSSESCSSYWRLPCLIFVTDPRVSTFLPILKITLWSNFIKGTHTEKSHQAILLNTNSRRFQWVAEMARCPSWLWGGPFCLPALVQIVSSGNIHGTSVSCWKARVWIRLSFLRFVSAASVVWNSLRDNEHRFPNGLYGEIQKLHP